MGGTAILFLTSTVFKLMKNPKVEACHRYYELNSNNDNVEFSKYNKESMRAMIFIF